MKRFSRKTITRILIGCIIGLVVIFAIYRIARYTLRGPDDRGVDIPTVRVIRLTTRDMVWNVDVTGKIQALATVNVIPEVSGRLERMRLPSEELIDAGSEVRKGDVIAVIEHSELQAAVNHGEAALTVAKASLESAQVSRKDAQREKNRLENLFKAGSTTEQQRDKAITAYEQAVAQEKLAQAKVAEAESALEQARVRLAKATLVSPITGVVAETFVDEGDMVSPSTALLRIVSIDTVRVTAEISERFIRYLREGETPIEAEVEAFGQKTFKGKVYNVEPTLDPRTHTVKVEARLSNTERKLLPGMFVHVKITLEQKKDVVALSETELVYRHGQYYAFIIEDGKVVRRKLRLGISENGYYEILEGVDIGDTVVITGQGQLIDGDKVKTTLSQQGTKQ